MASAVDPELPDRLHSAALHLLRRVRGTDRESGISPARLSVLSILVFGGPRTPGALAEAEQVRPPTITGLLRGLEDDGLVLRRSDRNDGRVARIEATRRGRTVLARARAARVEKVAALLDGVSTRDRGALQRAVTILEGALR